MKGCLLKLKQIVSVAVASILSVGSIVGLGTLANATELKIPNDTVKIGVVADGTHNGPGTETFVNSANGITQVMIPLMTVSLLQATSLPIRSL